MRSHGLASKGIAAALSAAGLLVFACGAATGPAHLLPGQSVPYRLFTHCGVLSARLDGVTFYADPPLTDGQGNPPRGWGNPFDDGTMTLLDPATAFEDPAGHHAHFTTQPREGIPSLGMCDQWRHWCRDRWTSRPLPR